MIPNQSKSFSSWFEVSILLGILVLVLSVSSLSLVLVSQTWNWGRVVWQGCVAIMASLPFVGLISIGGVVFSFSLILFLLHLIATIFKSHVSCTQESHQHQKLVQVLNQSQIKVDNVRLIQSDELIACVSGLIRPRIFISTSLILELSHKQLESVLIHEWFHLQKRHSQLVGLSRVVSRSFFFLPLLKDVEIWLRTKLEYRANNYVISYQQTKVHLESALSFVKQKRVTTLPVAVHFGWQEQSFQGRVVRFGLSLLVFIFILAELQLNTSAHIQEMASCETVDHPQEETICDDQKN